MRRAKHAESIQNARHSVKHRKSMNQTRDRRSLQLFELAIEMPMDKVPVFLDASCGDDKQLRAEVEALIGTQEQADHFLSSPQQSDVSTDVGVSDETNSPQSPGNPSVLAQGILLADRYEIVETIGTGGMGEVYLATDNRLDRSVAIKVLNIASQSNDEMQERFDREMKSVASLSHPM